MPSEQPDRPDGHAPPPTLLTTPQAAQWLSVTPDALNKWRATKTGPPYIRLGGAVRYDVQDLAEYVEANRVRP